MSVRALEEEIKELYPKGMDASDIPVVTDAVADATGFLNNSPLIPTVKEIEEEVSNYGKVVIAPPKEENSENNIIDFSDMEHLALSILVKKAEKGEGEEIKAYEPSRTALDYREYFEEILIDEYQDSNPVQEMLLESISRGENRFMVGDVKQSIYKFRLARPELFLEKYNTYQPGAGDCQRIDLSKNFRSRKQVVDAVNDIFSRLMSESTGGIAYDERAALYPGAVYPENEDCGSELILIEKPAKDSGLEEKQAEALAIAARIKELRSDFQVTDKESGKLRKASYKDIVILLRTNAGWDEDFKSILKEEGIPSHVLSRTGYFAAGEIRALLQLLRTLDNPAQDIPLFGVLKSCFGGFTDEEIAGIRGSSEDRNKNLYDCLKEQAEEEGDLQEKIRQFLRFLAEYRDKTVYMPIHELLQDIVTQTGYLNYVSAMPGGGQRRANVQMLLEKAAAFEQTSYYGLFHFVRYMEQLEKYDVDYGEANILDENADVVRIMSIHKSKGLEFPICFVCGLAKKFNMQDMNGKMIVDVDMGIGADYVDVDGRLQGKTVRKNIIGEKMRLDNLGEELRILYVALTRAKEKLILTGMIDRLEKKLFTLSPVAMRSEGQIMYGELAGAGNYLDFLLPALAVHPAMEPLWQFCGLESPKRKENGIWNAQIEIKILEDKDFQAMDIKEQILEESARRRLENSNSLTDTDSRLMAELSEIFASAYQHGNLADLYTKTTVSELKKTGRNEEQDFSFRLYEEETVIPYIPGFMREEESLGGAGRGSAFHKVMELIDFGEGAETVEEQIKKMQEEGMLSPEYAGAISLPSIRAFLSTDLAKRMAAAEKKGCLYREQPFVLGIPARELNEKFPSDELVLIQGIIDVYFEENGEIVVADYKTDRVDTGKELAEKYRIQLEYYARALQQLTGKKVKEKIIYSFRLHEGIML